jgi:hypothetical protein
VFCCIAYHLVLILAAVGTRDERLARVIHAKYEAGLLRPYNYVKGYARLSRWMDHKYVWSVRRLCFTDLSDQHVARVKEADSSAVVRVASQI